MNGCSKPNVPGRVKKYKWKPITIKQPHVNTPKIDDYILQSWGLEWKYYILFSIKSVHIKKIFK